MGQFAIVPTLGLLIGVLPALAGGQAAIPTPPTNVSTVVVTGRAERRLPADRATLSIAVETRGTTAAAAASQNARVQHAVIEALRARGIQDAQVHSAGFTVAPNWRDAELGRPAKRDGYVAENSINVAVTALDRIGAYVDAALAAGATNVEGVQFIATNTESARRAALAEAIANAHGDADVMAKAAGGSLGRLLEVSTERGDRSTAVALQEVVVTGLSRDHTEIQPREIEVNVVVITRWALVMP